MTTPAKITSLLDQLEADLPLIPGKSLELVRATTRRANSLATSAAHRLSTFASPVVKRASVATKTAVGQARSGVSRSASTLNDETEALLDDATDAVAPETVNPRSLNDHTKAELYERAQTAGVQGRSAMSKDDLLHALRSD